MVENSNTFGKSETKRDFNLIPRVFSFSNEKTLGTRLKALFASDFPQVFEFLTVRASS